VVSSALRSMNQQSATAEARANIALTKYWGNADDALRIPANDTISITLDQTRTVTTVSFAPHLEADRVQIDDQRPSAAARDRVIRHLDRFRRMAGTSWRAEVQSRSNFPAAAGIAASASGFAALTMACAAALRLDLSLREMSRLARQGSGSAARSIFGGFVLLHAGQNVEDAFAEPLHPADWWDVRDLVVVVSDSAKAVASSAGHRLAPTSPVHSTRLARVEVLNRHLRAALAKRDFVTLGEIAEEDALLMHAVMMTSHPALLYWLPQTLALIRRVYRWREQGLAVYFTVDAGPNVHLLTLPEAVDPLLRELRAEAAVREVLVCRPGPAARVLEQAPGE